VEAALNNELRMLEAAIQRTGRPLRFAPPLLPVLQGAHADADHTRKLALRLIEPCANCLHIYGTELEDATGAGVRQLPYDLLRAGRQLSLTLHDLCPQLSYPVVRDFFRAAPDLLDALLGAVDLPLTAKGQGYLRCGVAEVLSSPAQSSNQGQHTQNHGDGQQLGQAAS
jgi:hypothetical protein